MSANAPVAVPLTDSTLTLLQGVSKRKKAEVASQVRLFEDQEQILDQILALGTLRAAGVSKADLVRIGVGLVIEQFKPMLAAVMPGPTPSPSPSTSAKRTRKA